MLDDVALFVHIVQANGLAAAGLRLNIPAATVTRRLRRLEDALGVQLIHRSARSFALTPQGSVYYQELGAQIAQIERTLEGLDDDQRKMAGSLTVAAPTNMSLHVLEPMWADFVAQYPDIQLDLRLSNSRVDLVEIGADLALRAGPQPDSSLFQKRLGTARTIIAASPEYLAKAGTPMVPQDLADHRIIAVKVLPSWELTCLQTDARTTLRLTAATAVDDIGLAARLAARGQGITLIPVSEIIEEIRSGALMHVLPEWRGQNRAIYAVWPTGRLLSARARCFLDFMAEYIAADPCLQGEVPVALK